MLRVLLCLGVTGAQAATIEWSFSEKTIEVPAGEDLTISWTGGHNVVEIGSASDYADCEGFGSAIPETGNSAVTIPRPSAGGTSYFACGIGSHCNNGMKVAVTWAEADATSVAWTFSEQTVSVPFGQSLEVTWSGTHDVVAFADEAAYDACTPSTAVSSSSPTVIDDTSVEFLACSFHCGADMKLRVTWECDAAGNVADACGQCGGDGSSCALCEEDFHVSNNACVACAGDDTNAAGDDPTGADTACDAADDGGCADDSAWFSKKAKKTCAKYVSKKATKLCKIKTIGDDGTSAFTGCPASCGVCGYTCGADASTDDWHAKKTKKDCDWVAKKARRCKKTMENDDGVKIPAAIACPVACSEANEDNGLGHCTGGISEGTAGAADGDAADEPCN